MLLKEKRCGTIKGRSVADGCKQQLTAIPSAASMPTVAIKALMLSCIKDAKEEKDVTTADIQGSYLQSEMNEVIHVHLKGTMAELLVKLDPDTYNTYTIMENGKMMIYMVLLKVLYRTLLAVLLFWHKLSNTLVAWGFVINPYDWHVANKIINGKQCTVLWHVNDLKVSHMDTKVMTPNSERRHQLRCIMERYMIT